MKLRPVRESDLQILESIDTNPELSEPFEWRGFTNPLARRHRWEKDSYLGPNDSLLVISLPDDTFAGIVNWRAIASSGPPGVFEIGILLLPDYRSKGFGTSAQRLLVDYLFATTPANRIEATTESTISPSTDHSKRPASSVKACCVVAASSEANGVMASCTQGSETIHHRTRTTLLDSVVAEPKPTRRERPKCNLHGEVSR